MRRDEDEEKSRISSYLHLFTSPPPHKEYMNVQRFSFKEFTGGVPVGVMRAGKPFIPSGKTKEDAPPPPPTFSEEELKTAERAGYQKGFLEGEKEGHKQAESEQAVVERKLAETVEKFAASVQPLFDDYRKTALAVQEQLPKAALAIARKVAGHALAQNAGAVIGEMAARCYETMMKEPKLTITVHESLGGGAGAQAGAIGVALAIGHRYCHST